MDRSLHLYRELAVASSSTTRFSSEELEARFFQSLAALADVAQRLEREREKRLQAEEQARRHLEHLAHAARVAMLGKSTAALTHELNQPLDAISHYAWGSLERIRQGRADLGTLGGALESIAAQTQRSRRILRRLRSFLRRRESEPTPVDVNRLLRDVVILAEPDVLRQEVDLRLELDDSLPPVLADAVQIEQVVLNLMLNATLAMQPVAPEDRVLLLRSCFQSAVMVSVVDRGADCHEEILRRMFEPFFTTHEDGMGLGLAISRSIVETHGGKLWFEANPDGGLSFSFTLPALQEEAS